MGQKTEEKINFQVLFGEAQQFVNQYLQLRKKFYIKKEWISTSVVTVTPQDLSSVAEQLKGSPELIAKLPKAQTMVMISGLFEVTERKNIIES